MEGDSAWGSKAARLLGMRGGGALGSDVVFSVGRRAAAARAEKNPSPWGGRPKESMLSSLSRRAGDAGAEGGPSRLG